MTVDSYAHCGQEKYLPVEALDRVMDAAGVSCAVLCQHLEQFDNSYIAALIERSSERFAGVALIDHRSPAWDEELESVIALGFRGLRITSTALVENGRLAEAAASVGLVPVIYAAEGVSSLVRDVLVLAGDHASVPLVISHLGNPVLAGGRLERGEAVLQLAAAPNIHVLLSGLGMFCSYPYVHLDRLIESVIDAFGPDRVMWGSNYPVCGEEAADYRRDLDLLQREGRWGIDRSAARAISDTTGRRIWFE